MNSTYCLNNDLESLYHQNKDRHLLAKTPLFFINDYFFPENSPFSLAILLFFNNNRTLIQVTRLSTTKFLQQLSMSISRTVLLIKFL